MTPKSLSVPSFYQYVLKIDIKKLRASRQDKTRTYPFLTAKNTKSNDTPILAFVVDANPFSPLIVALDSLTNIIYNSKSEIALPSTEISEELRFMSIESIIALASFLK